MPAGVDSSPAVIGHDDISRRTFVHETTGSRRCQLLWPFAAFLFVRPQDFVGFRVEELVDEVLLKGSKTISCVVRRFGPKAESLSWRALFNVREEAIGSTCLFS